MADKDPFAEFGAPESTAAAAADPYADFGAPEAAPAEAVSAPVAGDPAAPAAEEPRWTDAILAGANKVGLEAQTGIESVLSPFGFRAPVAAAEALPNYLADVVTPGVKSDFGRSFRTAEQEILARQGENTIGDVAGQAAQSLVPLGAAAKFVPAPVRAAAGKVPGLLARYISAPGARIATAAGLGAAENVAQGVSAEVDQALAKNNTKQLAEKVGARVWDDAKTGALWGGAIGTGVEAVKLGLKSRTGRAAAAADVADEKLVSALETKRLDDEAALATRGIDDAQIESTRTKLNAMDDADTATAKATELMAQQDALVAPKRAPVPADDAARYAAAYEGHKQFKSFAQDNVDELQQALDTISANAAHADESLAIAAKHRVIRAAENGGGIPIRDPDVTGLLDELDRSIADVKTSSLADKNNAGLASLEKMSGKVRQRIDKQMSAGEVGDVHQTLDYMRMELGRYANENAKRGPVRDMARYMYEPFRNLLTREDLFGEAAKLQKPFQAAWAPEIQAESGHAIQAIFGKEGISADASPWVAGQTAKRKTLLSELANPDVAPDFDRQLRRFAATKAASHSVRADLVGSTDDIARAAQTRQAAATVARILDARATAAGRSADWASLGEQAASRTGVGVDVKKGLGRLAGTIIGGAAGTVVGPAGQIAGAVAGERVANRIIRSQLERDLGKAAAEAERRAVARSLAAEKAANDLKRLEARRMKAADNVGRVELQAGRAVKAAETLAPAARRAAITATLKDVDNENDPTTDASTGPMSQLVPALGNDLAEQFMAHRQARNSFLASKAGPPPTASVFGGAQKRVLDDETVGRMARYVDAVDDPTAALERIAEGNGTSEDHETVATVYPGMWSEFQDRAVAALSSSKAEVPYDQQVAIAARLRLPLVPELRPDALAFWQAAGAKPIEGEQPTSKSGSFNTNAKAVASQADAASNV